MAEHEGDRHSQSSSQQCRRTLHRGDREVWMLPILFREIPENMDEGSF